jgi:hypothetical protein
MAAATPEELQKNFEKLQRLATQLGKDFSSFNLRAITEDAETVKELLSVWQTELNDSRESLDSISSSFRDVVQQISKSNVGLNAAKSSFRKLSGLAEDISLHQAGINKLNKDDLQSIQSKIAKEKKLLELNVSTLKIRKAELESQRRQNGLSAASQQDLDRVNEALAESTSIVNENNTAYKDLLSNIKALEREQDVFNDKLGISGHAIDGMGSALDKLGFGGLSKKLGLEDAKKKMEEIASTQAKQQLLTEEISNLNTRGLSTAQIKAGFGGKELLEKQKILDLTNKEADALGANNGKLSVMKGGLKSIGSSFMSNLKDPLSLTLMVANEFVDALKATDSGAGDMAKKMNMTYGESLKTRKEFGNIAAMSGDAALNTKNLQETYMAVGQSLGTNAKLNEKDLTTMTKLVSQAGFQHSELMEIEKLSLANNKTLEDNTSEILGGAKAYASRKGIVVNEKDVLREVNKMSASLKLSLGGSASAMAEAVVKTKEFGLNLEQASKMSESLLSFESSIENELSAELLTGKNLNFETARQLAMNNDIAGAAEEIAKQVGTSADFAKMNALQQESIAKAAGLTKDELAQSLIDKEALTKIGFKDAEAAKAKYETLRKTMTAEQAAKALGDEALAGQYEQQSVQERFAQATEKLKDIFVSIAEPVMAILDPLMSLLNVVLPGISVILQGILYPIQLLGEGFNELFNLSGGFTDHLLGALKLIGGIAGAYALVKTIQIASNNQAIVAGRLEKGKLATLIAEAAAWAVANPFKAIAGLAIAGAVTAGLYSMVKGNDVMSPGDGSTGYGKRTLMGPEGAIQLNNKDTVIAGTDLFKKGDDVMSGPKGAITVANSTAPSPAKPDSSTLMVEEMRRGNDLREQQMKKDRTVSTLKIQ